ncbi:MAG: YitT family protein [Oscillospiraceae bacterium]|nr:YitT family protein [Oscillospiraceae bacterium]
MTSFKGNGLWTKDLAIDVAGAALYAAAIYFFIAPAKFATGGIGGIALILNHLFTLPIGIVTLVLNIPLAALTWKTLGGRFMLRTARTIILYTVLVDFLFPLLPLYNGDAILAALFGGVLAGAALGLVYKTGGSLGGSDFIIMAINKAHPERSPGQLSTVFDGVVILLGGVFFGNINAVLYGLVQTVVHSYVIDKIILGAAVGKIAMVITSMPKAVSNAIIRETGRGATVFQGEGGYTGNTRYMIMCACSKAQVVRLRRIVSQVDEHALVMVSDYSETFGNGFQKLEQ